MIEITFVMQPHPKRPGWWQPVAVATVSEIMKDGSRQPIKGTIVVAP